MIGRLKDTMETAVKAVSISNGVYSGIDEKKAPKRGCVVRTERLELSHLAAPEPKSGASTNFATSALI